MNLYRIVGVLVRKFGRHAFAHRGERIGQLGVFLLFPALFGRKFAFARNVVQRLIDIDKTCRFIKHGAYGIGTGTHHGDHLVDGRKV